jgi:hypothetical protein
VRRGEAIAGTLDGDHRLAWKESSVTASTSERGAALYSWSRYWMVRTLMPRISAAREVEPPVERRVSRMACFSMSAIEARTGASLVVRAWAAPPGQVLGVETEPAP